MTSSLRLLILVALGGIILGAVGMQYVGSWEGAAQALGILRQPRSPTPVTTWAAGSQPTDQPELDEHEGHTHKEEKVVRVPAAKAQQLGIKVEVARAGILQTSLTLPGTIALNADRQVHVVSRIPGIVQEIRKQLGDAVRAGEVMAVIDSRELADTKAVYLAARERVTLAETTFAREKDLWEKKISPEEDYLKAKQALAEVRIELQVAPQKLRTLGFAEASVQQLAGRANASLTRYEVVAPFAGTVIEKHIVVGEMLKDDTEVFVVADLSRVWVDLNLSTKDLALVRKVMCQHISGHSVPLAFKACS